MKTQCIIAIDEKGMPHVINKTAPVKIETMNLYGTTPGIYKASIDEIGHCSGFEKLMMPTRSCGYAAVCNPIVFARKI